MTADLSVKANNFTAEKGLFPEPGTVLAGVSGGADSMAMLHWLFHQRPGNVSVVAVHIHHGIRGDEADRDEDLVRAFCLHEGIRLFCVRVSIPLIAEWEHIGTEEAGRSVRYEVFEKIRREIGASYIATAHTASDRAETVLLHLIRGCGIGGLSGIPVKNGHIVRPLLSCSREDTESYCAYHKIAYGIDSTNTDERYSRNAVRCAVLPQLRRLNPSVDTALNRMADAAAADDLFLCSVARDHLRSSKLPDGGFDLEAFRHRPLPIVYRMIRALLEDVGCRSAEERHLSLLSRYIENGRGAVQLPGGFTLDILDNVLLVERNTGEKRSALSAQLLHPGSDFVFAGAHYDLSVYDREKIGEFKKIHKLFFKYAFDYDKIQGSLIVRSRLDGERFYPAGRCVEKTLKSVLQEEGVPPAERSSVPIICDEQGIVLVYGIRCDERVRPDEHTNHFLVCRKIG